MQERTAILKRLPRIIEEVRAEIRWKSGSAARHLLKRKLRGHLPSDATLYLYWHEDVVYPTVVCPLAGKLWLVMFSVDAIMETAFVVENPDSYLQPS